MSGIVVAFIISFLVFWFAALAYEAGSPLSRHPIVPEPWESYTGEGDDEE